jgi:DNA-binding CsgD family transcriptional regulator
VGADAVPQGIGFVEAPNLLERGRELAELHELARAAGRGAGTATLIDGPAGIGKSRLLAAAADLTREAGFEVLQASGGELERKLGWGVVRELFAPVVSGTSSGEGLLGGAAGLAEPVLAARQTAGGDADQSRDLPDLAPDGALHGLFWLTSNLAERRPLALLVDDAQWVDPPTVRWFAYLAARIEDLPTMLVLAHRHEEDETGAMALIATRARVIAPGPLSETACGRLIAELFAERPEPEFVRHCFEATAGNPFMLRELALELRAEGARPVAADIARVMGARPESISRSILLRLSRVPPAATDLVRAVAVLGTETSLARAAALAQLAEDEAARLADLLATTQILAPGLPLRFAHPIVRTIVYQEVPPATKARMHERASRLLSERGAEAEVVAVHLLATDPKGERRTVELLVTAARDDLARGVPESAAAFLRRAVEEGETQGGDAALLRELGAAEMLTGAPSAIDTLRAALDRAEQPRERALAALELGRALTGLGRLSDAVDVLRAESDRLSSEELEPELNMLIESELLSVAGLDPDAHRIVVERFDRREPIAGATPAERELLASLAFERACAGAPAAEAAELAARALEGGQLIAAESSDSPAVYKAIFTLLACDRFADARSALDAALEDALARGSSFAFFTASAFRCLASCWGGSLVDAESEGRAAVQAALASHSSLGVVFAYLVKTLVERDQPSEAQDVLRAGAGEGEIPDNILFISVLYDRGCLRIASGEIDSGIEDLFEVGRRVERFGCERFVSAFDHRSKAALALISSGERERAGELVAEELALARAFGAPRALGVALHAAGVVEGGSRGLELLREAVDVLERSESPLEHARSVVELGGATRRKGDRGEARNLLRRGLDLAHRCGAAAVERRAHEELRMAGARPRRERLTGPESLTAGERRVARMAAEGLSNREIAQQLFISLRTVETHLTHAYQKLDISSRRELADALRAG